LPAPYFRGKHAAMTKSLARLLFFTALSGAAGAPAWALPKHPPLPPERPFLLGGPPSAAAAAQKADARKAGAPNMSASVSMRDKDPPGFDLAEKTGLADLARKYALRNGVPLALLHRVIMRESRYCPRLVNHHFYGLMQVAPATARSMGFHGAPKKLLDAETNLKFATPYLANAWRLSGGDMNRAVRLYASGYYYTARNRHMLAMMRTASSPDLTPPPPKPAAPPPPPKPKNPLAGVFGAL
jgi:soluble lytic murein transglycosylase-like protein